MRRWIALWDPSISLPTQSYLLLLRRCEKRYPLHPEPRNCLPEWLSGGSSQLDGPSRVQSRKAQDMVKRLEVHFGGGIASLLSTSYFGSVSPRSLSSLLPSLLRSTRWLAFSRRAYCPLLHNSSPPLPLVILGLSSRDLTRVPCVVLFLLCPPRGVVRASLLSSWWRRFVLANPRERISRVFGRRPTFPSPSRPWGLPFYTWGLLII